MLSRKTETKYIGQYVTTNQAQTGVAPFAAGQWQDAVQQIGLKSNGATPPVIAQSWTVALPAQVQGVTDINRIGDRIEPVSHKLRMTVRFAEKYQAEGNPSIAMDTPLDVTAYIFYGYIKSLKTYQGATAQFDNSIIVQGSSEATRAMNNLLDDGDTSFRTFTGDPIDAMLPLSQYVNMKVKKVHLRRAAGYVNTNAGNGGAAANGAADNTLSKSFTLSYKPPAKLIYKTSTDIYPENYAPVFAVAYIFNDATASRNQAAPVPPGGQVEYCALSQVYFKDHQ